MLAACRTRATPERIRAVIECRAAGSPREIIDRAFARAESVTIPPDPGRTGFDPGAPKFNDREALAILAGRPRNRAWILRAMAAAARRFDLKIAADPAAAPELLAFLLREVSFWEADAFPLEAMADLENRYPWTFDTDAWSLREQLRREASAVSRAWRMIRGLAERERLFVILNESTPRDYLTCRLPGWAARFTGPDAGRQRPVLLHTGLKVSSSEHRAELAGSPEGTSLAEAVALAESLGRRPVIVDFSRRRFPRSFLRICRFARQVGWGVRPVGKAGADSAAGGLPGPKSPRGLPRLSGAPAVVLLDPWPVSDPEILAGLSDRVRGRCCGVPAAKPWQDDRIGARIEVEAGPDGVYRPSFVPWIVPALGGWMRADHLFKSRLARFVRFQP
jgi:hypothetical protein